MKTIILIAIFFIANVSYAGDKFTKISASGAELSDRATEWSCVKQNYSGLIWEVKTNFTRYTTSEAQEYKNYVNSKGLCGYSNWQIPSRDMLHDIYLNNNGSLDTDDEYLPFFPYIRQPDERNELYWYVGSSNSITGYITSFNGSGYSSGGSAYTRLVHLPIISPDIYSDILFNWAESRYPQFFSPASQLTDLTDDGSYFRYYPATENYAIVTAGADVYVQGDVFGGLHHVDSLQALIDFTERRSDVIDKCVTVDGLMWEVKTNDGGMRDASHTFTWWDPSVEYGYYPHFDCSGLERCTTKDYKNKINDETLCGFIDWRVPTENDVMSLANAGSGRSFFTNLFPNQELLNSYWLADGYWFPNGRLWAGSINFIGDSSVIYDYTYEAKSVMLVRTQKSCPDNLKLISGRYCIAKTCEDDNYNCPSCDSNQILKYHSNGSGYCFATSCPVDENLVDGQCICNAGQTNIISCSVTNGTGEKIKSCNSNGTWSNYGSCSVKSCDTDYVSSDGQCVCNTGQTNTISCSVTNGTGEQTKSCNADGIWVNYSSCSVKSCDSGYVLTDGQCIGECATIGNLTWEIKATDGGIRDRDNTYVWFDPNLPRTYTDQYRPYAGTPTGELVEYMKPYDKFIISKASCTGGIPCHTYNYVQEINNLGLCGHHDWRLPTEEELKSIQPKKLEDEWQVGYSNWYPEYWASSRDSKDSRKAKAAAYGGIGWGSRWKYSAYAVRLVRTGQ